MKNADRKESLALPNTMQFASGASRGVVQNHRDHSKAGFSPATVLNTNEKFRRGRESFQFAFPDKLGKGSSLREKECPSPRKKLLPPSLALCPPTVPRAVTRETDVDNFGKTQSTTDSGLLA